MMFAMPIIAAKKAANNYLTWGWSVIPIRRQDKRPLVEWGQYQHRRATDQDVKGWFSKWPEANVGIVTGAVSGLVVLDVDPQHGGEDSLQKMEQNHGPLPPTVSATTGGGGQHFFFAHPGGTIHNKAGVAPGIDLRGDGGYVVAPPSLHPSGGYYAWQPSHAPGQVSLAAMPNWLCKLATARSEHLGHPLAHWRRLVRQGVEEGERNNTIASLTGHLLWHGIDPHVALDLLLCWNTGRCRPPLPEDEVVRTVESIARLHLRHGEDADGS